MTLALAAIILIFGALLLGRIAGARRGQWLRHWPSVLLGLGAGMSLMRGQVWFALGLAGLAAMAWMLAPRWRVAAPPGRVDAEDAAARRVLGVGAAASAAEIRAAYRTKMAVAHPDRGGAHADAARLTAARDRLLKGAS